MSTPAISTPATHLRPREHGAYAMIAFPILSGLAVGGPSVPGVAFALLAVAGFLAHEAVLVVLGRRGERVRVAAGAAALRRLAGLGAVAAVSGLAFVGLGPRSALIWAAPPAVLGGVVMAVVLRSGAKSLAGELLVAAAFAGVHAPVAAAGLGHGPAAGAALTAPVVVAPTVVWALSFGLATVSVHALKARFQARRDEGGAARGGGTTLRAPGSWLVWAAPVAAAAGVGLAVTATASGHPRAWVAAALAPKAILALAVAALDVHPRHLKRVGWSLVAADTLTLGMLAAAP